MSMAERETKILIQGENVSKEYRTGELNIQTFQEEWKNWLARSRQGNPVPKAETLRALDGVSFEVRQGEVLGIIGKNGAGKSTLLKIISRITAPTEGSITVRGKVMSLLEVGCGFHPELTGRENIYLNGSILGMKKREIDRKLEEIIEF